VQAQATDLCTLAFGDYRVQVDPHVSARVVSFQYKDVELLTNSGVHPENYGSTLWISPHRLWIGAPPPMGLDGAPYKVIDTVTGCAFKGPIDPKTGLSFEKRFLPGKKDQYLTLEYIVTNHNDTARSLALWEVTRSEGGLSFFPLAPTASDIVSFSELRSTTIEQNIYWYEYARDSVRGPQKCYKNGSEGWLSHVIKDVVFVKQFPNTELPQAPPEHAEVEIYVHKGGAYVELENHSPYIRLAPGERYMYAVQWRGIQVPHDKTTNKDFLVKKVRKAIKNER